MYNQTRTSLGSYISQTVTALSNTNPVEKWCGKVSLTCGILPPVMCKQSLVNMTVLIVSYLQIDLIVTNTLIL